MKEKEACIRDGSFMNRFFETIQEEVYPFLNLMQIDAIKKKQKNKKQLEKF